MLDMWTQRRAPRLGDPPGMAPGSPAVPTAVPRWVVLPPRRQSVQTGWSEVMTGECGHS